VDLIVTGAATSPPGEVEAALSKDPGVDGVVIIGARTRSEEGVGSTHS